VDDASGDHSFSRWPSSCLTRASRYCTYDLGVDCFDRRARVSQGKFEARQFEH
jgi:hypothetical protein